MGFDKTLDHSCVMFVYVLCLAYGLLERHLQKMMCVCVYVCVCMYVAYHPRTMQVYILESNHRRVFRF